MVAQSLQEGFQTFNRKMKGFVHRDAVVMGPESRTAVGPNQETRTLCSIGLRRFYPTGEGGGYAGGILSAAMDGRKAARAAVGLIG